MRDIIKLVVVLTIICAVSGLALSGVYTMTKGPIEYTQLKMQFPAVKAVMKGVENDPIADRKTIVVGKDAKGRDMKVNVYRGKKAGKISNVAFKSASKGYHGLVHVMVGIDVTAKKLTGIAIVDQSETPGRGDKVKDASFLAPFAGKSLGKKLAKGDIKPLSGATISTVAVLNAVNDAKDLYAKFQAQMVQ